MARRSKPTPKPVRSWGVLLTYNGEANICMQNWYYPALFPTKALAKRYIREEFENPAPYTIEPARLMLVADDGGE